MKGGVIGHEGEKQRCCGCGKRGARAAEVCVAGGGGRVSPSPPLPGARPNTCPSAPLTTHARHPHHTPTTLMTPVIFQTPPCAARARPPTTLARRRRRGGEASLASVRTLCSPPFSLLLPAPALPRAAHTTTTTATTTTPSPPPARPPHVRHTHRHKAERVISEGEEV